MSVTTVNESDVVYLRYQDVTLHLELKVKFYYPLKLNPTTVLGDVIELCSAF